MTTNRMEDKLILNDKIGSHSVKTVIQVLFFIFFFLNYFIFLQFDIQKEFSKNLKIVVPRTSSYSYFIVSTALALGEYEQTDSLGYKNDTKINRKRILKLNAMHLE